MGGRGASFNDNGDIVYSFNKSENDNNDLPDTVKIEDSYTPVQISFRAIDSNENEITEFIPKNAIIENVHIFAGEKVKKQFRDAVKWNKQYKLDDSEVGGWYHATGIVKSQKYGKIEVHYIAHPKVGIATIKWKDNGKPLRVKEGN